MAHLRVPSANAHGMLRVLLCHGLLKLLCQGPAAEADSLAKAGELDAPGSGTLNEDPGIDHRGILLRIAG